MDGDTSETSAHKYCYEGGISENRMNKMECCMHSALSGQKGRNEQLLIGGTHEASHSPKDGQAVNNWQWKETHFLR